MDPLERFDGATKRVLTLAQDEAVRLRHNYIVPEHLLIGLLQVGDDGVASRSLHALGVDLGKARSALEFIIGSGMEPTARSDIVLMPRGRLVLDLALDEGRRRGDPTVAPLHMLLGLTRDRGSAAWGILESLGVTVGRIRRQLAEQGVALRDFGGPPYGGEEASG